MIGYVSGWLYEISTLEGRKNTDSWTSLDGCENSKSAQDVAQNSCYVPAFPLFARRQNTLYSCMFSEKSEKDEG